MNLFDGLETLGLVKDGDVKTYLASDLHRARNVLIHWMPLNPSYEIRGLLELLDSLPASARALILEAGIRDGQMYLITENPAYFPGLKEWLTSAAHETTAEVMNPPRPAADPEETRQVPPRVQAAPAPAPLSPFPPPSGPPPGEFTRLFNPPTAPAYKAPVEQSPPSGELMRLFTPPDAPAAPSTRTLEPGEFTQVFLSSSSGSAAPSAPPPPRKEPGEFTRIFQNPDGPQKPAQPVQTQRADDPSQLGATFLRSPQPKPPPATPSDDYLFKPEARPAARAPAAPPPPAKEPGEFTRIFQNPDAPQKPAQPVQSQKSDDPSEWDATFLRSPQPKPAPATPSGDYFSKPAAKAPAAPPPPRSEPGEFTRFFQNPLATPTPATPSDDYFSKPAAKAPAPPAGGEFTRTFGKPGGSAEPPEPKEATGVFSVPPAPQAAEGPSEYTRMIALPPELVEAPQKPAPVSSPEPPPVPEPKSALPLILILAFLAVLALVLIFFFIRK
jgi:hypothetical protein